MPPSQLGNPQLQQQRAVEQELRGRTAVWRELQSGFPPGVSYLTCEMLFLSGLNSFFYLSPVIYTFSLALR